MRGKNLLELARTLLTSDDHRVVFLRFAAVGGAFTGVYMVLAMLLAIVVRLEPAIASLTAHIACVPPTYWCQRTLAFRSDAPHARAFWRYVALQAPLVAMSTGMSWLLIGKWRWPEIPAFVVIGLMIAAASFVMQRFWAFAQNTR